MSLNTVTGKDRLKPIEIISYSIPYMWNLKRNYTNELTYKTGTNSQTSRRSSWLPGQRGKRAGRRDS